jgi:hypothetical protein
MSQAAYVRQALSKKLERDGFKAVSDQPGFSQDHNPREARSRSRTPDV